MATAGLAGFSYIYEVDIPENPDEVLHVDNIAIMGFINEARLAYMAAAGLPGFDPDSKTGHTVVVNHCEYRAELFSPDTLRIGIKTMSVGNSSIKLGFRLFSDQQAVTIAEAFTVAVAYDFGNKQKLPVLESIRKQLRLLDYASMNSH